MKYVFYPHLWEGRGSGIQIDIQGHRSSKLQISKFWLPRFRMKGYIFPS